MLEIAALLWRLIRPAKARAEKQVSSESSSTYLIAGLQRAYSTLGLIRIRDSISRLPYAQIDTQQIASRFAIVRGALLGFGGMGA